jgi:transcription antitermination factor NusG
MSEKILKWYAIHTRSRFERKVHDGLRGKTIEAFYPKIQTMSRRKDRRMKIMVPMLPGYVFVRSVLDPEDHLNILKTAGVVRLVGFKGVPAPVKEEEISSLMILDGTDRTVQNRSFMKGGDRVIIMEGPLKGLVGVYLKHKGQGSKVFVSIELLHRSLVIDIEDWALEKVS